MHHDQGGLFSQGGKDGSIFQKSINVGHHINKRTGKKKSHNHLNRCRKIIRQNSTSIHNKLSYQTGYRGNKPK